MSIGVVAIVAVLVTNAYFSDTETSKDNRFEAGALDLQVDYEGYYNKEVDGQPNAGSWELKNLVDEKFFDIEDVKPGDYGEGTISLHVFNNDAWACVQIKPTANDDMSSTEPELEAGDVEEDAADAWDGELAQNMSFMVWADVCRRLGASYPTQIAPATPGDNIYQPDCDILLTEGTAPTETKVWPLADYNNPNVFTGSLEPLLGSHDYYLGAGWEVPSEVGNIIQTDAYLADISFYTEQYRHNSEFSCENVQWPRSLTSETGDSWGPSTTWQGNGRWGDGGLTGAENEIRIDDNGSGPIWSEAQGSPIDGLWVDGATQDFKLTYDGSKATLTIGKKTIDYTEAAAELDSNGRIVIIVKTHNSNDDGTYAKVEDVKLDGLSPTGPTSVTATTNSGVREIKHLIIDGDTQLSDGFEVTGKVTFDWGSSPQKEGPAFIIGVENTP